MIVNWLPSIEETKPPVLDGLSPHIRYWWDYFGFDEDDFLVCPSLQKVRMRITEGSDAFDIIRKRGRQSWWMNHHTEDISIARRMHRRAAAFSLKAVKVADAGDTVSSLLYVMISNSMVEHSYASIGFRGNRRENVHVRPEKGGKFGRFRPQKSRADQLLQGSWIRLSEQ